MDTLNGASEIESVIPILRGRDGLPCILMVSGPTASGKTPVAIRCALALNAEIVSADSRQIYQRLSIGTAKPSRNELDTVRHYFIDHVPPEAGYTAGQFFQEAVARIMEIHSRGKNVVVAGGTGLYIRVLRDGIFPSPVTDGAVRRSLETELQLHGLEALVHELRERDPSLGQTIDTANPHRVMRALEVCRLTGLPFSEVRTAMPALPYGAYLAGLRWDREALYRRIEARVEAMLDAGLTDEVRAILDDGISPQAQALNTVGYKEIISYFSGVLSYRETVQAIRQHTRNFAKRQMTWFRKEKDLHWYDVADAEGLNGIHTAIIQDFLRNCSYENRNDTTDVT